MVSTELHPLPFPLLYYVTLEIAPDCYPREYWNLSASICALVQERNGMIQTGVKALSAGRCPPDSILDRKPIARFAIPGTPPDRIDPPIRWTYKAWNNVVRNVSVREEHNPRNALILAHHSKRMRKAPIMRDIWERYLDNLFRMTIIRIAKRGDRLFISGHDRDDIYTNNLKKWLALDRKIIITLVEDLS